MPVVAEQYHYRLETVWLCEANLSWFRFFVVERGKKKEDTFLAFFVHRR